MDLDRDRGALTQTSQIERSARDPLGSIYALGLECDVRMMGILMGKCEEDFKKKYGQQDETAEPRPCF